MPCCLSYSFCGVSGSRHGGEDISEKTYACVLFLENERAEGEGQHGNGMIASRRQTSGPRCDPFGIDDGTIIVSIAANHGAAMRSKQPGVGVMAAVWFWCVVDTCGHAI